MKKLILFIGVSILLNNAYSQERLFFINNETNICATKEKKNTKVFDLNERAYNEIIENKKEVLFIELPFFNNDLLLKLVKFEVYASVMNIYSKTEQGDILLNITPQLLSYKIFSKDLEIGVINFLNGKIVGTFKLNNKQFEIAQFKGKYILFEVTNSINSSNFSCAVDSAVSANIPQQIQSQSSASSTPVCIELAIEIDQFTRQTFNTDQEALDWALAIMAGVSQIYESETNAAVQVSYTYIWNSTDPYNTWIAQSGSMLSELKNYWTTNNVAISRDLVHLLTKRTNTGTGGIAYVDVLCDNGFGYGFSSNLDNDTNFSFPNPTYTWNLNVCSHEIGHNVKSKHTHWCGWAADPLIPFAGGVIDNCVDVEGSCPNNPLPQLGTIMSYCHTTSGGILLDFHDVVVSQALDVGISNATCLTTCDYYGCTDITAFNYNPNATIDDGSCIPEVFGCIDVLATNYDVIANTDDGSCTYCSDVLFDITDISCNGYADGSVDVTISNGAPPYLFSWEGPNGFTANSEDINNIGVEGVFQIVVEDALLCKDTSYVTIIMPDPISIINTITDSVSCNGYNDGSVLLNISGGTQPYNFDYGINNPQQLPAGSYNVIVSDDNSCPSVSLGFDIGEPDLLQLSIIKTDISCDNQNDGYLDLSVIGGSGPFTYLWSGPNGYSSLSKDISSLAQGLYNVNVSDNNGCVSTNSSVINNPLPLAFSLPTTQDASCNGGDDGSVLLNISGGTTPYFYLWNNGAITQNLLNVSANSYSVDVSDAKGCSLPTINATIYQPNPSSVFSSSSNVSCNGFTDGSIDISYSPINSSINYTFLWSDGSITEDVSGLSAGLYNLTITENNTCFIPISVLITEPAELIVQDSLMNVSCKGGSDGYSFLSVTGGTPFYSYNWSTGTNTFDVNNLSAGSYLYTVTDAHQCTFDGSIFISEPATNILIEDSVIDANCYNSSDGKAYLDIQGGGPPYAINWLVSNPDSLSYGYHLFELVDEYTCFLIDSVFINQPSEIIVAENVTDAKCSNEPSGSALLSIQGGISPYFVNWNGVDENNMYSGSYIYIIEDSNNCVKNGVVTILEPSEIIVSSIVSPSTCVYENNGSVNISIVGGAPPYVTDWLGNNPLQLQKGIYNFAIIDSNLCVDSNQVTVYSISDIEVQETINDVSCNDFCDGEINLLISNGAAPYQVELNDLNNIAFVADSLCGGQYIYTVVDNLMCEFSDTFNIFNPDLIQLSVSINGNILAANVTGGLLPYYYSWYDSSSYLGNSQQITTSYNGEFTCIVFDSNYCYTDSVTVNTFQTGVADFLNEGFLVYPNPTRDIVNIESVRNISNIYMTDILGKRLKLNSVSNKNINKIDCSNLAKGIYLLSFNISESKHNIKVIVE
ncbi:M12 family metallo-peptidase, partial [Flavobacteriales bacterium]|nr:M12 family metallo-peptidase [Flavobacteriales bacterium]